MVLKMKVVSQSEHSVLEDATDNINEWYSYWNDNIKRGKQAVRFCMGEQWDLIDKKEYDDLKKVRLTLNKLDPFVQQAIGEYRQNLPDILLRPTNDEVPAQFIEQIEGYVRHISKQSNSDIIYSMALEDILQRGFGAIQIYYEYKKNSFDLIPKMRGFKDASRVFFDPLAQEVTKEDSEYCGYYSEFSRKEFEAKYPKIQYPESFGESIHTTSPFWWGDKDHIRICDYYKKERFKRKILMLDNQQIVDMDLFKRIKEIHPDVKVLRERTEDDYIIKCYKLIKDQIIEETKWPSKYLPLIFALGKTYYDQGLEYSKPYIENAMDIQRFQNYIVSTSAQILKMSHKGKYMMTKKQISALTSEELYAWKTPELASLLIADPDRKTGSMPTPITPAPLPPELLAIWQGTDSNIESVLGRYGSVKGMDTNELSGVAAGIKIMQGNVSLIPLFSNMERVVRHVGVCLVDLIANISYNGQNVPILRKNNEQEIVPLNVDIIRNYEYLVDIQGGSNFALQKQQNIQTLINFVKLLGPDNALIFADLIAGLLDIPNVNKVVERVTDNILPPQIRAQETGQPPPQTPPNPQLMLEQQRLQTQAQQAQADLMKAQADMLDAQRKMEEISGKRNVAATKAEAEIQKANIDLQTALAKSIHSSKEESLSRENEQLRTDLSRHQQMLQFLQ